MLNNVKLNNVKDDVEDKISKEWKPLFIKDTNSESSVD